MGTCVPHVHQQNAYRYARDNSLPSTEMVVIFNGTPVQAVPDGVECVEVPDRLSQPCGLWPAAFTIAVDRDWEWCAILHDDFWMLEAGWEAKLAAAEREYWIGMAAWCAMDCFDEHGMYIADQCETYGSHGIYQEGLAVVADSMGLAFNMALFSDRGCFCDVPEESGGYGYGEVEAALWTLQQEWALWHLDLSWEHYNDAWSPGASLDAYSSATAARYHCDPAEEFRAPATRKVTGGGLAGFAKAQEGYGESMPAHVVRPGAVSLNGRVVDVRRTRQ